MDTVVCEKCGGTGTVTLWVEDIGTVEESCPYCSSSGQKPVCEDGSTDFRRVFEAIISPTCFAKTVGAEMAGPDRALINIVKKD